MQGTEIDFADGKKRNLVISIREAKRVELMFGGEAFDAVFHRRSSINVISALLYSGLQRKGQPEVTMEEVEDGMAAYIKGGGSYWDYFQPIGAALVEGGIMTWVTKEEKQSPNGKAETESPAPSPLGGTE